MQQQQLALIDQIQPTSHIQKDKGTERKDCTTYAVALYIGDKCVTHCPPHATCHVLNKKLYWLSYSTHIACDGLSRHTLCFCAPQVLPTPLQHFTKHNTCSPDFYCQHLQPDSLQFLAVPVPQPAMPQHSGVPRAAPAEPACPKQLGCLDLHDPRWWIQQAYSQPVPRLACQSRLFQTLAAAAAAAAAAAVTCQQTTAQDNQADDTHMSNEWWSQFIVSHGNSLCV